MKKMWGTRVLAMLLVLALTAGLVPAALAANSEVSVAFKQVPNDTLDTLIRPDLAVGEIENAEMGEDTAAYQAHDLVRVSIILEDASTENLVHDPRTGGSGCCLESDAGRQHDLCQCGIRQDRAD